MSISGGLAVNYPDPPLRRERVRATIKESLAALPLTASGEGLAVLGTEREEPFRFLGSACGSAH